MAVLSPFTVTRMVGGYLRTVEESVLDVDLDACRLRLGASVAELAASDFRDFLSNEGILTRLARAAILSEVISHVTFHDSELPEVISRLWEGVEADPPLSLSEDWFKNVPVSQLQLVRDRWDELRRQKYVDQSYGQFVDTYFLQRRDDLDTIVYGMIRLRNQGAAEELYLSIVDDGADFNALAKLHSLGDERFTHGLVGPMLINQPHASIRQVLSTLQVGETAPPLHIDPWFLILKLEYRNPARLSESVRQQLLTEMFDLELTELIPQLTDPQLLLEGGDG